MNDPHDHLHEPGDDPTSPRNDFEAFRATDDVEQADWINNLKLGAIPAPPDPRTLRLEDFLLPALAPPATFSNSNQVNPWDMLGNDSAGDCVWAGHAHNIMLQSKLAGSPVRPTAQEVLARYFQGTGGRDVGYVILQMLKEVRKDKTLGAPILGYAHVDPRNTLLTKTAIAMFGAVYRGLLLPKTAQSQTGPGKIWTPVSPAGDGAPASWGGHLTLDTGYDVANLETITWGQVQRVAPQFYVNYSMESWVVIPMYPVPGFDQAKFVQALKDLGTQVDFEPLPPPPPQPQPTPAFDITQVSDDALEAEFYRRTGGWGDMDIAIGFKHWGNRRWTGRFHEG